MKLLIKIWHDSIVKFINSIMNIILLSIQTYRILLHKTKTDDRTKTKTLTDKTWWQHKVQNTKYKMCCQLQHKNPLTVFAMLQRL